MNRYYYTFGTDPAFPYKKGWVEVTAAAENGKVTVTGLGTKAP